MKKKLMFSCLSAIISTSIVGGSVAFANDESNESSVNNDIVILHTNDSHCFIDNGLTFAGISAYKNDMEAIYENVTLVDAGDAVQGGPIGKLTTGSAIIEIMNAVGYDYFAIGNHEFDYQIPRFIELMDMMEANVLSANFIDIATNESLYDAYGIEDYNGVKVAYIGVTTPESFTKSTPTYFQDDDGNFLYSFSQGNDGQELFDIVQKAIDDAISEGADYIVGIGHLGIEGEATPWRSIDVIENTVGFDIFIDGHSHSEVVGEIYQDASGEDVVLCQAGEKLDNIGKIIIDGETGEITAELITADEYFERDADVQAKMDSINEEFESLLNQVVAKTEVQLSVSDPISGERIIRNSETNLGNLVADAYRTLLNADVALVNGGGIREDILAGDITYNDIISVHPFGNQGALIKVTGQTILDALEMGAMNMPEENGGFLNVSGLTYTIDTNVDSSITVDEQGSFLSVDGEYRVKDVLIAGEVLDLNKEYTVASHDYMLLSYGDGMSMFKDAEVINNSFMVDCDILINYITENLDGVVGEEYANTYGNGRINVIAKGENELDNNIATLDEVEELEPVLTEVEEVVEPTIVEPTIVEPTIVEPTIVEPAIVEPAIVEPTVVEPTVIEPTIVEPAIVEPTVIEPTVIEPTVIIPTIIEPVTYNNTYTVVNGDSLWKISKNVLGNPNRYNEIYQLNTNVIKNKNKIYVGQVLQMPKF